MTQQTIAEKVRDRKEQLDAANRERAQLQALDILIEGCTPQPAPQRIDLIDPTYKVVTIGIGRDNTATLLVTADDMKALDALLGKENVE